MPFSSPAFLSVVLPLLIGGYFSISEKWRNGFLLLASLSFYLWIEPVAIIVMLILAIASYYLARLAAKHRFAVISAIAINVVVLVVYKYNGFFIDHMNLRINKFALAAGMSFYVFQLISYVMDVRSGKASGGSLSDMLLYVSFLPKIPCGPIVRFQEFVDCKRQREALKSNVVSGMRLFFLGLAKKALIADMLARIADPIFGTPVEQIPCVYCWLGAIAYSLQIYFDFSGYSDMAIGLASVFNFRLPTNFDFPYASRSLQEFWRRWHMSLSFWFRDYVYIPLGGGRRGTIRACFNTLVVFLLCGIWHGSTWTFFFWGAYHGIILVLEKLWLKKVLAKIPAFISNAYLLLVVVFGWVLFRSSSIQYALGFISNMLWGNSNCHAMDFVTAAKFATYGEVFIFVGAIAASFPAPCRLLSALNGKTRGVLLVMLAVLSYVFAMTGTITPGIYESF